MIMNIYYLCETEFYLFKVIINYLIDKEWEV